MVVIIDYGMGNLFSVKNALDAIGAESIISDNPEDLEKADKIILPGVGAFPDGMKNLKKRGFIEVLKKEVLNNKKPFLGICLGMQLLATDSEEHKLTKGLGWINGHVKKFNVDNNFRIPHMGWNDVFVKKENPLFGANKTPVFYFVHSYHIVPNDLSVILATCNYGEEFVAAIQKDNVFGVQFHPEKSQKCGLEFLKNFLAL
jgi:imidazole glycerol-phosphate synthase subunit HisH